LRADFASVGVFESFWYYQNYLGYHLLHQMRV